MFSQTDKLFAALLVAFLVYITVKGQLPDYASLFRSAPRNTNSGSGLDIHTGNPITDIGAQIGQQLGTQVAGQIGQQAASNPGAVASVTQAAGSGGPIAAITQVAIKYLPMIFGG